MSKHQTTPQHNLIINKLRRQKHATFREICDYLQRESEMQQEDLTIFKRTFVCDMAEIGEIYGIYIKCDFSEELQNCRFGSLDVFNALKIKEFYCRWYLFAQDVQGEKVKCCGLERMSNCKKKYKIKLHELFELFVLFVLFILPE